MSAARELGYLFLSWGAILTAAYAIYRLDVTLSHWRWKRRHRRGP